MKKHLTYFLLIILGFTSCKKAYEPILDSPDVRLANTIEGYTKELSEPEFGWIGYYLTGTDLQAIFKFKFDDKNRVVMSADYRTPPAESSYRIKALQSPTLIFDTYSTLHLINDPTASVAGGASGKGFTADFEYEFHRVAKDTIEMKGVLNGTNLFLIRAKSQQEVDNAFVRTNEVGVEINKILTYFKRFELEGVSYDINVIGTTITLTSLENDQLKVVSSPFFSVGKTITLFKPVTLGKYKIARLTASAFDSATGSVKLSLSDGSEIIVKEAKSPLKYDPTSGSKWYAWAKSSTWVVSLLGFHIDGVDDALGLKSLAGYREINFIPFAGANTFDNARIVGTTSYGPGLITTIGEDGIAIFKSSGGSFGTIPAAATATFSRYLQQYTTPEGYYLIQTRTGTNAQQRWDMVNVADAKTWVSWQF